MKRIAVMGDSHVSLYSNVPARNRGVWEDDSLGNLFEPKWLGPFTFWRLCRERRNFVDLDKPLNYSAGGVNVTTLCQPGQEVLFVFGEIDVRCHILKFGYDKYEETVDGMIKQIKEYTLSYGDKFQFHFQSIVPTIYKVNFGNKVPLFPFVGNDEERRDVTIYFNEKLRKLCEEIGAGYFDIFDIYADENNMMILEKSDHIVHAMKTPELEEYIKEYFKDEQ